VVQTPNFLHPGGCNQDHFRGKCLVQNEKTKLARLLHIVLCRWQIASRKQTKEIKVHTLNVRQVAVSLSGAFIAAMLFVSAAVGPIPFA
jgi:hypothetical protein